MLSKTPIARTATVPRSARILDEADGHRLSHAVKMSHRFQAELPHDILAPVQLLTPLEADFLDVTCQFAHVGLLIFPSSVAAGAEYLDDQGLAPGPLIPSVVVRERLARRYQIEPEHYDLTVTRLKIPMSPFGNPRPVVEVFMLGRDSLAFAEQIVLSERRFGFEDHIALSVRRPTPEILDDLFEVLTQNGFLWEGGGHNPHEGPQGLTIFYFVAAADDLGAVPRRLELHAAGNFRSVLDCHPVDADLVSERYDEWLHANVR